ncbi:MAG: shikimate dehydrogenase, partial [Verrucomicrobiota bacterium]|nr:shikimate dehydrogenase [Verrucomicrobiota bacterium]
MEMYKADVPTMYFIGVTTGSSSSARIFPEWAETLELGECRLVGIDLKIHDRPENYREVVDFIKSDPLSLGALVTTHKMDLFNACENDFDMLDPLAKELGEVSSIYKREGKLCARATDPTCGGMALEKFLPEDYFRISGAEVLVLGAGGSSLALV